MEERDLKNLMEMFFDAELTAEEERELCRYLRDNDVPARFQKDKEAVLALCGESVELELPAGAKERLVGLIDLLDENEREERTENLYKEEREVRILNIPRYIWSSGVAAVLVIALFLAHYIDVGVQARGESCGGDAVAGLYSYEEDTFDNPEDALKCAKAAFGDVFHAVNIAHANMKEIGNALEFSVTVNNTGSKRR